MEIEEMQKILDTMNPNTLRYIRSAANLLCEYLPDYAKECELPAVRALAKAILAKMNKD